MELLSVVVKNNKRKMNVMKLVDIIDVLTALSKVRKLFWSEDDFKFEFATMIKVKFGDKVDIRLEKRYEREKKSSYTDIVIKIGKQSFPIELKYKTVANRYADYDGEEIQLKTHSAVDLGCYAYLKDIERLEYLSQTDETYERGFAIILTNEPLYYKNTGKESVYDDFKIYEGREVHPGILDWDRSGYNPEKLPSWLKSHPPFSLMRSYKMEWRDYGSKMQHIENIDEYVQFKYQIAVIDK